MKDFDTLWYYIVKAGEPYKEEELKFPVIRRRLKSYQLKKKVIYATQNNQYYRHIVFTLDGQLKQWVNYNSTTYDDCPSDEFKEWLDVARKGGFMKIMCP